MVLAQSWQDVATPRLELVFDEAKVFRRNILVVQAVANGTMLCFPLQEIPELPATGGAEGKLQELVEQQQAQEADNNKIRVNNLRVPLAATAALYEALSNSLFQLIGASFGQTVSGSPLSPVRRGESRVKTPEGKAYIVGSEGSSTLVRVGRVRHMLHW